MKPRFSKKQGLLLIGILLVGGIGLAVLRNSPFAPVTQVTTVEVARNTLQPSLFGIGVVESRRSILIGPTAAGRVAQVLVESGDQVKAGQLLAEMDPIDLQERLAASRHALLRARSTVAASLALALETESRFATADASAKRYSSLRAQGFVSAEAERAKGHESRAAEAALQASRANIDSARADGERLSAEVRALEKQLANTRLIAPVDGLIVTRELEPGSTAVAGQAVLRMAEADSYWLRVRIDQGRSAGLAVGQPATIILRSRPGESFAGKVARIEQMSDAVTEERLAMVAFEALPAGLTLNEMAEVTMQLPTRADVMAVPPAALVRQNGKTGVFVAVDGRARFRPVRFGVRTETGIEVLNGLNGGEAVITRRIKPVADGDRVRVTTGNTSGGDGK
jgi:HlyD family secretion protein